LAFNGSDEEEQVTEDVKQQTKQKRDKKNNSVTEQYKNLPNEIKLDEDVVIMSDKESEMFHDSLVGVEFDGYNNERASFTLSGEDNPAVENLSGGDYVYIQGDEDSLVSADRIFRVDSVWNSDENTVVSVSEPYYEDVFESMEISFSDLLTEDNFVKAQFAEGVSAHFGDASSEIKNATKTSYTSSVSADLTGNSSVKANAGAVKTVSTSKTAAKSSPMTKTATDYSSRDADLIVNIDYDFSKNAADKDSSSDEAIDKEFGIKGSFGIKDLTAHMVSDIPSITDPKELYFGVSGELFADIDLYGKVSASAEMEAEKRDTMFATLEGIRNKRFPIAVFQFNGTTPVYITNAAFKNQREQIIPALYLVLYADWEGKISLELNGGFEYTNTFNSGLRLINDGEFCFQFEEYPYYDHSGSGSKDGMDWNVDLGLEADTELTLFGSSLLVYVGGVNLCELSVGRLGIEAACKIHLKAGTKEGLKILDSDDTEFYIRGFLKFIEAKVKLKADGKGILSKLSVDVDFEFALLDITLFEKGLRPDKYKPAIPVSTKKAPNEFESIITLVSDVSGSMNSGMATGETKLEAAKEAAKTIVDLTENWALQYEGNYGIGVIQFASNAKTISIPHIDYSYLRECIESMGDGGGTSIYSGIDLGVSQLVNAKATSKVMILMTDGQDSNDSATLASAKKAAEANIKIYTIGFGEGVNENILKQIAETTGGEYRYASTDNIVGIMGGFIFAQQSANSKVVAEYEGAVSEGETSAETDFVIDSMDGDLVATTVWPGSFLDTIITDPNGRVVDEKYPNATIDESRIPSMITVKKPIKGKWSVKVKGIETSYDKEPFYTVVSFKEIENTEKIKPLSSAENAAAHCVPIGICVSLTCLLLLICINKKKKSTIA